MPHVWDALRNQRELGFLELALQVVVSHPVWVLGAEFKSPGRIPSALRLGHLSSPSSVF